MGKAMPCHASLAFFACLPINFRQDQAEVKTKTNIYLQALLMAAVTS